MMTITIILATIIQAISISLGVGSSTLAILNFFYAISDGTIDPAERGIMGMTYLVLRIAMVLILITTLTLLIIGLTRTGQTYLTGYISAQIFLIFVLFLNAILMTKKVMPSKFGPGIQASSWYSLGFILTLLPLNLANFTLSSFVVVYVGFTLFMVIVINTIMKYRLKA